MRCFFGLKMRAKTPLFRRCSAKPREGKKRRVVVKKYLFLGIDVSLWSTGHPCRRPARPQMEMISSQSKSRQRSLPGLKRKKRSYSNTVCPKTPRPTRKMPILSIFFIRIPPLSFPRPACPKAVHPRRRRFPNERRPACQTPRHSSCCRRSSSSD